MKEVHSSSYKIYAPGGCNVQHGENIVINIVLASYGDRWLKRKKVNEKKGKVIERTMERIVWNFLSGQF